jgi:hypothetical protein
LLLSDSLFFIIQHRRIIFKFFSEKEAVNSTAPILCSLISHSPQTDFTDAAHGMRYIMPPVFSKAARACAMTSL